MPISYTTPTTIPEATRHAHKQKENRKNRRRQKTQRTSKSKEKSHKRTKSRHPPSRLQEEKVT